MYKHYLAFLLAISGGQIYSTFAHKNTHLKGSQVVPNRTQGCESVLLLGKISHHPPRTESPRLKFLYTTNIRLRNLRLSALRRTK